MPVHEFPSFPDRLLESEILIVGAGAVGLALAVSLGRQGQRVTVLECGPQSAPADYQSRNAGPVTGHPHDGILNGRMKALGGTTRLWGGQLVPFDRGDLESRDDAGRALWPISYEEYARWVARAYDLLGIDAQGRDTAGLWQRATGNDPDFGQGLRVHMNIWLPQPDFTAMFARDIADLPGLDIVTDAEVTNLAFAEDGRVSQVEVCGAGGEVRQLRAREVILASGTMEISRLLLRTAAIAPGCPYAENPHIGRWYLDHLHGLIGELHDADQAELQRLFDNVYFQGRKYNVKVRGAEGADRGPVNIAMTLNPRMTPREVVTETLALARRMLGGKGLASGLRQGMTMTGIMAPLVWRYLVKRRSTSLFGAGTAIGIEIEQLPNPACRLTLDPSQPPEIAAIGVHWAFDGREIAAARAMAERFKTAVAARGLGRVEIDPRILAQDPAVFREFTDSSHQMGGARMAETAEHGVTDPQGRVFGAANLSIAGAAVFPSGSFANCTLSAIALGLRTAERVAAQVSTGRTGHMTDNRLIEQIVFGCARLTGGASERASLALLGQAFDAGVRAVDVAPSYGMGTAEIVVGKAVQRAAARGIAVKVHAKLGSGRDPRGLLKTWVRAAKRLVSGNGPRPMEDFAPQPPRGSHGEAHFDVAALKESLAVARGRLGRIDVLMLHEAGAGDVDAALGAELAAMAAQAGAAPGYAVSWIWDAATDAAYPGPMVSETALDPALALGTAPPPPHAALFHSIIPTMHYLARTDPAFATGLEQAAALVDGADEATRRIAAFYALVAARAPEAGLIYASNDAHRLGGFLAAVRAIDNGGLRPAIVACFP